MVSGSGGRPFSIFVLNIHDWAFLPTRSIPALQAGFPVSSRQAEVIKSNGALTFGDCEDVLGYGRTLGVHVFEYPDSIGFTRREGDTRTLG